MTTATADSELTTARYGSVITADATTDIPDRIEVMRAGAWPEHNNKGRALEITRADLQEFADNFHAGIGVPGGSNFGQIPIDFSHNDDKEAAGWITDLTVDGDILYASVTWTQAGRQALEGGMYKCFSPSFWPACLGEYPDPENHQKTARNVLVGGGLTNIPFFKDLNAIMASKLGNKTDSKTIKGDTTVPTLDEVRIKEVASLTDDDKKILCDNASELSDVEKTKFVDVLPKVTASTTDDDDKTHVAASATTGVLSADDAKLLADMKSGKYKMIEATAYNALEATVNKLEADNKAAKEREVTASVIEHVKRGAIKADQAGEWTKRIIADESMQTMLAALPSNKLLASEIGNSDTDGDATKAFETKVNEIMASDKVDYATAVMRAAQSDSALANAHDQQTKQ